MTSLHENPDSKRSHFFAIATKTFRTNVSRSAKYLQSSFTGASQQEELSTKYTYYILFVLALVLMFNQIDRHILAVLLVPIQNDLGVSDTAMGLLTGFGFAAFYAIAALPLSRIADKGNRRNLLAISISVWSFATAVCGLVANYWQLLFARIGVASGEAAAGPANMSMIGDLFPAAKRGAALGIFMLGASTGVLFGYFVGAQLGETFGWRMTFVIVGVPGILIGLLIYLTVPEPARGVHDGGLKPDKDSETVVNVLRYLIRVRTFPILVAAKCMMFISVYGWMAWAYTYMLRIHELPKVQAGLWVGLAFGLAGAAGNIVGGFLSDHLAKAGVRWYLYVCSIATAACIPVTLIFVFTSSPVIALFVFWPFAFFTAVAVSPSLAAGLGIVRPRMRGFMSAVSSFCINFVGAGTGPFIIGVLSDFLKPTYGDASIRYAFLSFTIILAISAILYYIASLFIEKDTKTALMIGENNTEPPSSLD